MNGRIAFAAVALVTVVGVRRWALAETPAPRSSPCGARIQIVERASALLACAKDSELWSDGDRVLAGAVDGSLAPGPASVPAGRMSGPALRLLGLPVDVNGSTVEDLQALPGVGPKLAERIAAERPYRCPSDLKRVPGIGPKRWAELKQAVTVDAKGRRVCADHL